MLKVNKQVRKFMPTSTPKQSSLVKCKVTGSFFLLTSDMASNSSTVGWSPKKRQPCNGSLTLFPAAFFLGSPNKASNERKRFPATYIKQLQLNYVRLIHSTYKRNHLWTGRTDIATV